MEILVVADDFTGANDTGVQFFHRGLAVDIVFNSEEIATSNADVVVINTNSRSFLIENAQEEISQVFNNIKERELQIYKKVDSTLRGNIGGELEACLQSTNRDLVIFCSALPAARRFIKNGICYVNGKPLLETEFATDPKTPITSSSIKEIISNQTSIDVIEINTSALSEQNILDEITKVKGKPTIFVMDAENERDLKNIGHLIQKIEQPLIVAGSSGLAKYVFSKPITLLPMLFVVGSMSEKSNMQIQNLLHNKAIKVIELTVTELIASQSYRETIIDKASLMLAQQQHLILKTDNSIEARRNIHKICHEFNLNRVQLGEQISSYLAEITESLLMNIDRKIGGLFLTGGDIAMQITRQLKLNNYRIAGEIESGVPYGYFMNPEFAHIPVITKAGAFASDQVLQHSLEFIEKLTKEY